MKRIFLSLSLSDIFDNYSIISQLSPVIDGFHLDFMDGIFVAQHQDNLKMIEKIRNYTDLPLWIHAMTINPQDLIGALLLQPGDIISIHFEHHHDKKEHTQTRYERMARLAAAVQEKGGIPSCALSPHTSLDAVLDLLPLFPHFLLMTVNPGLSGQKMLPDSVQRYEKLRTLTQKALLPVIIGIDGGLNSTTLTQFPFLPTDNIDIAAHSALLATQNPKNAAVALRNTLNN